MQELAGALRKILNSDWRVYSYKADFATLWSLDNPSEGKEVGGQDKKFDGWVCGGTGEKHALIVWDGMPEADEQPINILDHLTPFDWALSLSRDLLDKHLHNRQKEQLAALPALQILILDLYSHHYPNSFACRMLESILPAMPWMKVFRLLPRRADSQSAADKNGPEKFCEAIKEVSSDVKVNPFPPLNSAPGAAFAAVKPFVDAWTGNLLQSGSHHDVNNLLGPLLLSETFNDQTIQSRVLTSRLPRRALLQHARWLGLAPDKEKVGGAAGGRWFDIASSANELGENIVVTLLDDQANNGWADILAGALDLKRIANDGQPIHAPQDGFTPVAEKGRVTLSASTSCEAVLKKLEQLFPDAARRYDYRFDLGLADNAGEQAKTAEILLWDLRLSWDRDKEIDYFQRALALAHRLIQAYKDKSWPWVALDAELIGDGTDAKPGLLGPWLGEAKAGSHGQDWRKEKNYLECLTLLPRIIATMDLSLPIVIFSSSGQRQITESVKGFGNIITAFEKPRFSGYLSDDVVMETKAKLCTAFEQAMKLLTVRRAVRQIVVQQATNPVGGGMSPSQPVNQHRHLTIAFEESGDFRTFAHSAIGGVVVEVSASDKGAAQEASFNFFEALRKDGVNFYDHVPAYTEIKRVGQFLTSYIPKKSIISGAVRQIIQRPEFTVCKISTFRCLIPQRLYNNSSGQYSDGTYLTWLSATLELLIAEYLPSLGYGLGKTSLSIWFPTRSVGGSKDEAIRCDFDFNPNLNMVETIGGRSVAYAIFSKALAGRKCFGEAFQSVSSLKVRKIPYFEDRKRYVSALHWYCVQCGDFAGVPTASPPRAERLSNGMWRERPFNSISSPGSPAHRQCNKCNKIKRPSGSPLSANTTLGAALQGVGIGNNSEPYLSADYTVAAHLADASLSTNYNEFPNNELGGSNIDIQSSFDVEAGSQLNDFLHVGRLFDQRLPDDGFKVAYKHEFFVKGIKRDGQAPIERRLISELAEYAKQVNGTTLIELAGLPIYVTSTTRSSLAQSNTGYNRGYVNYRGSRQTGHRSKSTRSDHHPPQKSQSPKKISVKPQQPLSIVLTGFSEDISASNVAERVYAYLSSNEIPITKDQVQAGESKQGKLKCDLHGLSEEQSKKVKGLKTSPGSTPPWRDCNVITPAR